jgi:hypothetical protein
LGIWRIGDRDTLNGELSVWYKKRNWQEKGVDWQFTTGDARIKLKWLYPVIIA